MSDFVNPGKLESVDFVDGKLVLTRINGSVEEVPIGGVYEDFGQVRFDGPAGVFAPSILSRLSVAHVSNNPAFDWGKDPVPVTRIEKDGAHVLESQVKGTLRVDVSLVLTGGSSNFAPQIWIIDDSWNIPDIIEAPVVDASVDPIRVIFSGVFGVTEGTLIFPNLQFGGDAPSNNGSSYVHVQRVA